MSQRLNATLISCDWNELLDSDLAKSLVKLQYVLDLVDSIGPCILFFDEFEKKLEGKNKEDMVEDEEEVLEDAEQSTYSG